MEYSLLARGVEREVVPAALDAGMGLLPWSPLGRGVLAGTYGRSRETAPAGSRAASPTWSRFVEPYLTEEAIRVVEAVRTAAKGLGVSPVAVALAWVRDRPAVTAPIVGARTADQLTPRWSRKTLDPAGVDPQRARRRLGARDRLPGAAPLGLSGPIHGRARVCITGSGR